MERDNGFPGVAEGRYIGTDGEHWLELRVDAADVGIVSGDVQSAGPEDGAGYASFRTSRPDGASGPGKQTDIDWTDMSGATADGQLCLSPSRRGLASGVHVSLVLDTDLGGLRGGNPLEFEAAYAGPALRELHVEMAVEEGVDEGPDGAAEPSSRLSERVSASLAQPGFAIDARRSPVPVRRPDGGWQEADIFATLQDALSRTAPDPGRPGWELSVLMLSGTDTRGLHGVMFDLDGPRPRQGVAVFVDTIRADSADPDLAERKVLKTTLHEIGHALNLRHPFGPDLRQSGSLSPMNYDFYWRGGGASTDYWAQFKGTFADYELEFLRHAPRSQVIPGGAPFGSARYWPTDDGRTGSDGQAARLDDLQLWLTPPSEGRTFGYGQPILLEVNLLNTGSERVWVPRHVLDLKAGILEILVRQLSADGSGASATPSAFAPMMQRCFDVVDAQAQGFQLGYGDSLHNNANLSYGSGGAAFPDPGVYELTPVLTFPANEAGALDPVVMGRALTIRVAAPQTRSEERDGDILLHRSDVGLSLALGGSTSLRAAAGELSDMRDRRRSAAAGSGRPDPVVAALSRLGGIFEGRTGNIPEAARLLTEATTGEAARFFDPHTAEHTRRLAARYRDELAASDAVVVVDLWTRAKAGGPTKGGRGSGFLTTRGAPSGSSVAENEGKGWGALAPAVQLPAEAMDDDHEVSAVVTVSSPDGLTERVAARRIDLVSESEGGPPELALLELSRPVPAPRGGAAEVLSEAERQDRSVLPEFFGMPGTAAAEVAARSGAELNRWTEAADQAMANAPRPRPPLGAPPARVHRYAGVGLDEVAGWGCWWLPGCEPAPPPGDEDQPYPRLLRAQPPTYKGKQA